MKKNAVPRIRVFAGLNGSGKSTLLTQLARSGKLPLYFVINPDNIQEEMASDSGLLLADFGVQAAKTEFLEFVSRTSYQAKARRAASRIRFLNGTVFSSLAGESSYNAAMIAAFLRHKLVMTRQSFSFESVFSHPSKLDELKRARRKGYRVYLYFVATDAVELSIGRVRERVESGGHDVPEEKISKRYFASLSNLVPALRLSYRAFIFDNSGREACLVAEKQPNGDLVLVNDKMPMWCADYLIKRLSE